MYILSDSPNCSNPLRDSRDLRLPRIAGPCSLVIFGVTGDLAQKKLLPAVYDLANRGLLPPSFGLTGFARRDWTQERFIEFVKAAVQAHCRTPFKESTWRNLAAGIRFVQGTFDDPEAFERLSATVQELDRDRGTQGNHAFYMSVPPRAFPQVAKQLAASGLSRSSEGAWRRVIIEKPFGHDLASAKELDRVVSEVFAPSSVFRIDHYLGKETVQNMQALRFANAKYEPIWNANYVAHVQITLAEDNGHRLYESPNATAAATAAERGEINYHDCFVEPLWNTTEYLWAMGDQTGIGHLQRYGGARLKLPYSTDGFCINIVPTFECVEMYYTHNGLPWDRDPETMHIDPYAYNAEKETVNLHVYKEPRFYASVGYDRGTYRFNGGKMTIKAHKGEPQGFTGSYDNEYQSYNGYFCQKWVNEQSKMTLNSSGNYSVSTYMSYVFPYMRIAELYLSYAEADFEYDGTLSDYGYECLNKIRSRCGLPTFQDSWSRAGGIPSGQKLRDIIRRERSIEFMLEGRRFHDIRRWKIAEECLRPIPKAWNIEGDTPEKFYKLVDMKENDTRIFTTPKHYWLAIPNSQLNINGQLVQNPGY